MKRMFMISALLLCACNQVPSGNEEKPPKRFETFPASFVSPAMCYFFEEDYEINAENVESPEYLFATRLYPSDERNVAEAVVRFGGETIRLVPKQEIQMNGKAEQAIYTAVDYPDFDVTLDLKPDVPGVTMHPTYTGMIKMNGMDASAQIKGNCDAYG